MRLEDLQATKAIISQALDLIAGLDLVWINVLDSSGSGHIPVYHKESTCFVRETYSGPPVRVITTRESAERVGARPCARCAREKESSDGDGSRQSTDRASNPGAR